MTRDPHGIPGEDREEQAAAWCVRLAEAKLAPAERQVFDAWFADADNAAAFGDAVALWDAADLALDKPEMLHARSEALDLYRRANGRRWLGRDRRPAWIGAIAAGLALLLLAGLYLLYEPARIYETGIGERQVAMLEDGSRLTLDAGTRVESRMNGVRREITLLGGRAKFEVARDPLRPFSVTAGDKIVVATGTAFSVELIGDEVRVLLLEGRVEVLDRQGGGRPRPVAVESNPDAGNTRPARTALAPGHELVTRIAAAGATVAEADAARSLSWESGQLSFEGEPLSVAAARMNRYSNARLTLADEATGALRLNGVFTAGDTASFLEGVRAIHGVRVTRRGEEIVLTRR